MTTVLNIDTLQEEAPYEIVWEGVTHKMVPPTLEVFIANLKDLEALAAAPNVIAETEATIRMICRAFPTLTVEVVRKWPVNAIERLFNIIRGMEDEVVATSGGEGKAPAEK